MFYLFNLLLIPLYYFIIRQSSNDRCRADELFFKIACLHAILFRALADPYNYVDTVVYAEAYEDIGGMTFSECLTCFYVEWGVGYVALNWLLSRISSDPLFLFTVLSIGTVGGAMLFYRKTSYAYLLTVLFYLTYPMLYYQSFGVVRQHFSCVLLLAALYNIDSYRLSVPLAIIAALMHTSSLIFLPFFFWRRFRFDRKPIAFYLAFTAIAVVVFRGAVSAVLTFFPRNEDFADEGSSNVVPIIVFGITACMMHFSGASKRLKTETEKTLFSFLLYGVVLSLCCSGFAGGGRLTIVFLYVIPVLLTYLKKYTRQRAEWYYGYCLALFCLIVLLLYIGYEPGKYDYLAVF